MLMLNTKYCTVIASQLLYLYDDNFFQFESNHLASAADHSALMQQPMQYLEITSRNVESLKSIPIVQLDMFK
jgi:hypothetical protein